MKISPLTEATRFVNQVREKTDGRGNSQQHRQGGYEQQKNKQDDASPTLEDIDAAVQAFGEDVQTQANGLSASTEGAGPGLKVVLKDGNGATVRQFTGEEFLKLREAASRDVGSRGKILDQKL